MRSNFSIPLPIQMVIAAIIQVLIFSKAVQAKPDLDMSSMENYSLKSSELYFADSLELYFYTPYNGSVEIMPNEALEMSFSDSIKTQNLALYIYEYVTDSLVQTIFLDDTSQSHVKGNNLLIEPNPLGINTQYYIIIEGGAITNLDGSKPFNGIFDKNFWSFTTNDGSDNQPPNFVSETPETDNKTPHSFELLVALDEPGTVYYTVNEPDTAGFPTYEQVINGQTSSGGAALRSGAINVESSFTTFKEVIEGLPDDRYYDIFMVTEDTNQNVQDYANSYGVNLPPDITNKVVIEYYNPYSGNQVMPDTHFEMYFSEKVKINGGNIYIKDYSNDNLVSQISIFDTTQTEIGDEYVYFKPISPLDTTTSYYIQIDSNLVTDFNTMQKSFAGIYDKHYWQFQTNDGSDNKAPEFENGTPDFFDHKTDGFTIRIVLDEPGEVFYTIEHSHHDGNKPYPTKEQVMNGLDGSNQPAIKSGHMIATQAYQDYEIMVTGLMEDTDYQVFFITKDSLGNAWEYPESNGTHTNFDYENKIGLNHTFPYSGDQKAPVFGEFTGYFSEDIELIGSGSIFIKKASDNSTFEEIALDDVSRVSIDKDRIEFQTTNFLQPFTEYYILIDSGSVTNFNGTKVFNGIKDPFKWRFKTNDGSDETPPQFVGNTPDYDKKPEGLELAIALNEPGKVYYSIVAGDTSYHGGGNYFPSVLQVIEGKDKNGSPALKSGEIVATNAQEIYTYIVTGLDLDLPYDIFMVAVDTVPNIPEYDIRHFSTHYHGENNDGFEVIGAYPFPEDENVPVNTAFGLEFEEEIVVKNGDFRIKKFTNDSLVFTVNTMDTASFKVEPNKFHFTLPAPLAPNTKYYVLLDSGVIENIAGDKGFEGAPDKTVWFFTTGEGDGPPVFTEGFPEVFGPTLHGFEMKVSLNEAGKVFYTIVESESDNFPSPIQVKEGLNHLGQAALQSGEIPVDKPFDPVPRLIDSLQADRFYDVYFTAIDFAGNLQLNVKKRGIQTGAAIPVPPVNLFAEPVSSKSILLQWVDDSPNEDFFIIFRKKEGETDYSLIGEVQANNTEFLDINLEPGKKYFYKVIANNQEGDSGPSNIAFANTFPDTPINPIARKPFNVKTDGFVAVWDEMPGATGYLFSVASDSGFTSLVEGYDNLEVDSTAIPVGNLSADKLYFYRIKAKNEEGNTSGNSNVIVVKTLKPEEVCKVVTNISDSTISATEVKLTWTAVEGAQEYLVKTVSTDGTIERVEFTKHNGIILFQLLPNTNYELKIASICSKEPFRQSEPVAYSITTGDLPTCEPVSNLAAKAFANFAELSWTGKGKGYLIKTRIKGENDWEEMVAFDSIFSVFGLESETEYEAVIHAICDLKLNHYSVGDTVNFTTESGGTLCEKPTDLLATVKEREVTFTWEGDTVEAQSLIKGFWVSQGKFTSPVVLKNHPIGEFESRIRAVCGDSVFSAWTQPVKFKVGGVAPDAPTNLVAEALGKHVAKLTWDDNSANEFGFQIERKTEGGEFKNLAFVPKNATEFYSINLKPQTTYYFRVKAINDMASEASNVADATTLNESKPPQNTPFGLNVEGVTQSAVWISWKDSTDEALGYEIQVSDSSGHKRFIKVGKQNAFIVKQLKPATSYNFAIQGFNIDGVSGFSESIDTTTASVPVPPTAPVFSAQGVDVDKILISWDEVNFAGVKIERRMAEGEGKFREIATIIGESEFTDDKGLVENTLYEYRLRAVSADGNSGFGIVIQARTLTELTVSAPDAPLAFVAEGVSTSQVNLSWEDNSNNEKGFILERKEEGEFIPLDTLEAGSTWYTDADLDENSIFEYRLSAFNIAGNSSTVEAEATTSEDPVPPSAPSGLSTTFVLARKAGINWSDNANNETGFKVVRNGEIIKEDLKANTTWFVDEDSLAPKTTYKYVVIAYNHDGEAASDTLEVTTTGARPSAPLNFTAGLEGNKISAKWEAPEFPNSETVEYNVFGRFVVGGVVLGEGVKEGLANTSTEIEIPQEVMTGIENLLKILPNIKIKIVIGAVALNEFGRSGKSNTVVFDFSNADLNAAGGRIAEGDALVAPTKLSGYKVSATAMTLNWDDNAQNEDGYKIFRAPADDPLNYTELGSVDKDISTYADETIVESKAYNYLVVATKGTKQSDASNVLTYSELGVYRETSVFAGSEVSAAAAFGMDDNGYVIAGANGNNILADFWKYNSVTDEWEEKDAFPGVERAYSVSFEIDGNFYIGTGSDGTDHRNDFWKYDSKTGSWTQLEDFPGSARAGASAFVIDGTAYIGTGSDGDKHLKDFWKYDATNDSWTQLNDFEGVSRSGAVAFVVDGKGYIATGDNGDRLTDVWEYNATEDSWTQKADFDGSARAGAVSFVIDGKAYLATGDDEEGDLKDVGLVVGNEGFLGNPLSQLNEETRNNNLWEYDATNDVWTKVLDVFGDGRSSGIAMTMDGRAYVGLGSGDDGLNKFDMIEFTPITSESDKPETPTELTAKSETTDEVNLAWTATDPDALEIRLERALTSVGEFVVLDTLPAGTTTYVDKNLINGESEYSYRVRAYSKRGLSPYSNVASITAVTGIEDEFLAQSTKVYPNPSEGIFNLEVDMPGNAPMTVKVFNTVGKVVNVEVLPKSDRVLRHQLDLSIQPSGIYLIQVITKEGARHTRRVIKN
ncbi:fibronectin type III domain-containing protein [Flexithrix dorotheae]|uniref:fibronectin type III domain-containing protein n=1 Tax=Flexithrix dorotheae TaxID=70993 RepID=UPI000360E540|nr:fibronectin type III domain-containing protein [Flexithrix dorotheae]